MIPAGTRVVIDTKGLTEFDGTTGTVITTRAAKSYYPYEVKFDKPQKGYKVRQFAENEIKELEVDTNLRVGDAVKVINAKSPYYLKTGDVVYVNPEYDIRVKIRDTSTDSRPRLGSFLFKRNELVKLSDFRPAMTTSGSPNIPLTVTMSPPTTTTTTTPSEPIDAFERSVVKVYSEARELLLKKHHDYGPKNISRAPGGALNGLLVRMHDKFARIINLVESGAEPENESLRDSFVDMANYAMIGLLVLDGDWPDD